MKFVKYLAWVIVILFVVIPSAIVALLMTTNGSRFIIDQSTRFTHIEIKYTAIQGNLLSSLELTGLEIENEFWQLSADTVKVSWQPTELIEKRLVFEQVYTDKLLFKTTGTAAPQSTDTPITLPDIQLPIHLVINQFSATNSAYTSPETTTPLPDLSGRLAWKDDQLSIPDLQITYEAIDATVSGRVQTSGTYPLQLSAQWSMADPIKGAQIAAVSGQSTLVGDVKHLRVENAFSVSANARQQTASIDIKDLFENPSWLGKVEVSELAVAPFLPMFLEQDSALYEWLSNSSTSALATVDNQQIMIERLELNQIGEELGAVELQGVVSNYLQATNAPEQVEFDLNLTAKRLAVPNELVPQSVYFESAVGEVRGNLAAYTHKLLAQGTYADNKSVNIDFYGRGSAESVDFEVATITSKLITTEFSAQANWQTELNAEVDIKNLSAFPPELAGYSDPELSANGKLSFLSNRLSAHNFNISWMDNEVVLDGAMTKESPLSALVKIPNLEALYDNDYLAGTLDVELAVVGQIDKSLRIEVKDFNADHPDFGQWQTNKPATINLPVNQPLAFSVTDFCVISDGRTAAAELCLASASKGTKQTTQINGANLPLALLNRFRSAEVAERIWGLATLNSTIVYDTETWTLDHTEGNVGSERTVLFALDEEVSTRFEYWRINWAGNTESIKAEVTAELEDDRGLVIGDITISDLTDVAALKGEIIMELHDLTVLQWVLPDLRYEEAQALALITIGGNAKAPEITGSVELAAKEIGFAQSGLLLTDVRIAAFDTPNVDASITLDGQAQSGDGWISIKGNVQPLATELDLQIEGESFRAVQLPTATIDVSPNINIRVKNQRIDITGEVLIPYAVIDQPELSEIATTPSADVKVFENGEPVTQQSDSLYPLYADVRVTLGDKIQVTGFGFEGELAGSLRVSETPTRALTATGGVSVTKGFYELYGQRLEIERGSLIYSGGPIANPGLDLRVVRAQENIISTEQVSVGAQISGTLLEPDFRLYSTPAMPDSEVLSYLILGRGSGVSSTGNENLQLQALILLGSKGTDLLGESLQDTFGFDEFGIDSTMNPNDTSFYVGKYLSPRLYVKYGVGLFENTNSFLIRYLLSEKLIIETTTSGQSQGGDIFYTIEK
jgi:translocation and assembly module TamB